MLVRSAGGVLPFSHASPVAGRFGGKPQRHYVEGDLPALIVRQRREGRHRRVVDAEGGGVVDFEGRESGHEVRVGKIGRRRCLRIHRLAAGAVAFAAVAVTLGAILHVNRFCAGVVG